MAKKLYYITEPRRFELPDELRQLLLKANVLQPDVEVNFDGTKVQYFKGLKDADIPGAKEVISALAEFGAVTLVVEN